MKIILVIPCCNQNKQRIKNQIDNLKWSLAPSGWRPIELIPIFVFGRGGDTSNIPFETMVVDVDEKYTNLHLKFLEAYKRINDKYDFDFILKIDDDTKINIEKFKKEWIEGKDYIGRFLYGNLPSKIILELDHFNIYKTIYINPRTFEEELFRFVTGECCFFSKKAINHIYKSDFKLAESQGYAEDRLFGYLLRDDSIIKHDIKLVNDVITENNLQVTSDYFTIHPINESLYPYLIGLGEEEQMEIIKKNQCVNLLKRKIYLETLEYDIKEAVIKFLNSKKTIGLG